MTIEHAAVLFAAGVVAGAVNAVAGGGSLISFPALVWSGIDPIAANATNTVAISPGAFAAMLPFRRELSDMRSWLALLAIPSIVGGAAGAVLLLATPEKIFADLVPGLILFATAVFALQETFARWVRTAEPEHGVASGPPAPARSPVFAVVFQLAIAVYGGYFGAGIGIMMLAALGFLGLRDLHRMIGLRSFLGLCINAVASLYFVASGTVHWPAAALMTLGQVTGGYGGASLARRVPRSAVRAAVVAIGILVAASLFLTRR